MALSSPSADVLPAATSPAACAASRTWWDVVTFGGVLALSVGVFVLQRGRFFRGDDWTGLAAFHDGPTLIPFNGALSLANGVVFGVVADVARWNAWVYRAVAMAAFAMAVLAVHWFVRRILDPAVAALAALLLATSAAAAPLMTEPFTAGISLSIAMLVVLVRNLDVIADESNELGQAGRGEPRRRDIASVLLLAALLATSWVGVAAAAIVATTLATQRASRRRWAAFAAPAALWLGWFAVRGELATEEWNWPSRARYLATLFGRTFQHLACNSSTLGVAAATAFGVVLWTDPRRSFRLSWPPMRWLVGAVTYALVTTYRNGSLWLEIFGTPIPGGDTWVIATFVVLAGAESVRGRSGFTAGMSRNITLACAGVALALSTVALVHAVDDRAGSDRLPHGLPVDELAAVESVGRVADNSWTLEIDPAILPARRYLAIVNHLGSPLDFLGLEADETDAGLFRQDVIVVDGLGIEAVPGSCPWRQHESETLTIAGPARVMAASVYSDEPTALYVVRRAAPLFGQAPLTTIDPHDSVLVAIPDDGSGFPWTFVVGAGGVIGTCAD